MDFEHTHILTRKWVSMLTVLGDDTVIWGVVIGVCNQMGRGEVWLPRLYWGRAKEGCFACSGWVFSEADVPGKKLVVSVDSF